jgi:Ala-tRNA(Pro) deacylase
MAISSKLKGFLDQAKVKYTAAKHPVVYTAQEIAAAQHVPGRQLAKSVLVKTDAGAALAVLPAIRRIDLPKLKALLRAKSITIGKEADIKQAFPDVEVGAMSPFGNLYGVTVVVDKELAEAGDIVFNAGSHTDTVKMRYVDFSALVKPKSGAFGQPFPGAAPAPKKKASKPGKGKKAARKPKASKKPAKRPAGKKKAGYKRR